MKFALKVCGMRSPENITNVISAAAPQYLGLIFYPKSPRFVPLSEAAALSALDFGGVKKVGVFVNAAEATIIEHQAAFGLELVQLHGQESSDFCARLRALLPQSCNILKAWGPTPDTDWQALAAYEPYIVAFLFDTPSAQHGGTGRRFDWSILQDYPLKTPFWLSGGLDLDNIAEALLLAQQQRWPLQGLDVNSRFELAPALKNTELLAQLRQQLDTFHTTEAQN